MPFYKLICRDCGEAFEKRSSIEDRTEKRITCPSCGSSSLETDFSAGVAGFKIKNNERASCPHSASCGCGCTGRSGGGR